MSAAAARVCLVEILTDAVEDSGTVHPLGNLRGALETLTRSNEILAYV